jgi:integrase
MAWLERDRLDGPFLLVARLGEKKLKRSTRTKDESLANEIALRVQRRLRMVEEGELEVPDDADVLTFLMSDSKKPQGPTKLVSSVSLQQLCQEYQKSLPEGAIEENTRLTMEIHLRHLQRILGANCRVRDINRQTLQGYINKRAKETGLRGKKLKPATIKKDMTTFGTAWKYALDLGYVSVAYPNRGLVYPKAVEKSRFLTWQEIEQQIEQGGLTKTEEAELWDCLFLTLPEVDELLAFVKRTSRYPFLYPMVLAAAHTGARRSELIRSMRSDFDFRSNMLTLHEKKRVRGTQSHRTVPMSPLLREEMQKWFATQPVGRISFCLSADVPYSRVEGAPQPLTVDQAHTSLKGTLTGKWSHLRGWHVLRHSFASNCAAQGVDQRTINAWMGHQTEEMVRRYRHLIPDQQQNAIRSVFGATSKQPFDETIETRSSSL